jgi:two-component system phosphate regulon sensor histidine kinase PhoR
MKKTLFLRTFLGYVAIVVLLASAVMLFAPPLMRTHHIEERAASLEHMALLLEGQVLPVIAGGGDLAALVSSVSRKTGTRITVIDPGGEVLADSEKEPRDMENHLFRPEIQASLRGETLMSIRPSSTLKADMMYMSIPLRDEGRVVGALRLSVFMKDIEALLAALRGDPFKVVGAVTLIAFVLAFFLARSVTGPSRVIDAAKRNRGEISALPSERRAAPGFAALQRLTGRLKEMFGEIRVRNEEIQSILASIREGLCVLDRDARIVLCNASFRRIAGSDAPEGRHFWEVVRSSSAAEVVRKAREGGAGSSAEIALCERAFFCSVSRLAAAERLVVTLTDVTELRHLRRRSGTSSSTSPMSSRRP